jgi:hypothetical protein
VKTGLSDEQLRVTLPPTSMTLGGILEHLAYIEVEALGEMHPAWGGQGRASLRWVLVHMVEEYARHNGYADLIRESIDGQTGE